MPMEETKRTRRTGAARTTVRRCPSFFTLPDDLLLTIYRLLAESQSSRARFAAVCRSWRASVAAEPRVPALPWLLLSPHGAEDRTLRAHCPEDGAAMSLQPHHGAVGRGLVGGYDGGWVVSSQPLLRIVNLFTGDEIALFPKQRRIVCPRGDEPSVLKIVLSDTPTSDGCIMAAMTENCRITPCRVGCPVEGWRVHRCHGLRFKDIAFHNGDLYGGTSGCNKLLKYGMGVNKDGAPIFTTFNWINMQMLDYSTSATPYKKNASYIDDLNGNLTVAVIDRWRIYPKPFFRVFELINTNTCRQVTSLGDHALFLGPTFSKAVPVPADSHGYIERNHIYYSNGLIRNSIAHGDAVFPTDHGDLKYHRKHRKCITDNYEIKSVGYSVKNHDGMWLLPPDI